jgi:phosphoglycerate dehydrogenase-like enzyme
MPNILITAHTLAHLDGPWVKLFREAGFDVLYPPRPVQLNEEELLAQLTGVVATLAGSEPYTRRVLQAHPQLRVIARAGVGYDAVDVPAATESGIAVTITPNTNQESVAEHTFTLILALAKNLIPQHLGTKAGNWPRKANLPLRGTTLGLAGLGRIGKAVAERGQAFGMKLIAFEPFPDRDFVSRLGITLVSPFEKLLAESDWLSLHLPYTAESQHLINKRTLALMKPTAFLINTARGGLVCEADLIAALRAGTIAGAGLDVFEIEPALKNPLWDFDNVVITPHAAGTDLRSRDDMAVSAAQAIVDLSRGLWPAEKVVNAPVRPKFRF